MRIFKSISFISWKLEKKLTMVDYCSPKPQIKIFGYRAIYDFSNSKAINVSRLAKNSFIKPITYRPLIFKYQ